MYRRSEIEPGAKEHTLPPPNVRSETELGAAERLMWTAAGGVLVWFGVRQRSLPGVVIALAGTGLLYQGIAGQNVGARVRAMLPGAEPQPGLRVRKSVTVNRPASDLYDYWRNFENLPHIMKYVQSVRSLGGGRSHWVVKGPGNFIVEWDAELLRDVPNEMIAWATLPGAAVQHRGSVKFVELPTGRGTEVHVAMEYFPPGGELGKLAAGLLNSLTVKEIHEGIRNFKQVMESGEVPAIEGQPSARGVDRRAVDG
jgi:uncharacterized membrane protein